MNKYILASYFNPQQTIILIVVSVVGLLLIVLNIVLAYVFHKRGERKLFSKILQQQREMYLRQLNDMRSNPKFSEDTTPYKPFFQMEPAPVAIQPQELPMEESEESLFLDEDQDIVEEVFVNGIMVRYNRSFTARIIQATDELKVRYSELKNYILSYKGVKSKISWKKETFRHGRNTLITFVVRGKTLCMCLALDPKQFEETKYKVTDLSIRSPKSKTPCMYRISNDRRVKYGKELIDMLFFEDYFLEQIEHDPEDFIPPYESTDALIARNLIRVVAADDSTKEIESPSTLQEEIIDTVEESNIDEPEDVAMEEIDEEAEDVEESVINGIVVHYNKSFVAKLSQGSVEMNFRYSELKNYMLSYKGVKNRISWKKEAFNQGRNTLAVLVVRGKTLCMCLALDPKQFEETKYKVADLSIRSPKSKTPCLYRILNDRRLKYAKELIDMLFKEQLQLLPKDHVYENYAFPYENLETLIEKGLVRVIEKNKSIVPTSKLEEAETVIETPIQKTDPIAIPISEELVDNINDENLEDSKNIPNVYLEDEEADDVEEIETNGQMVRYNRSYLAAITQVSDDMKQSYSDLKNYILSFKGVKSRINWKRESFFIGKESFACFIVRNKTLCLCLATDPNRFKDTKYKVIDLSLHSDKSKLPCMYRVTTSNRLLYAKELIELLLAEKELEIVLKKDTNYSFPYETTEELISKGLIRVSVPNKNK